MWSFKMKKIPLVFLSFLSLFSLAAGTLASPLTEAEITQIINDVKVVDPAKGASAAALKQVVKDDLGVQTGGKSRAELLFADNTLTRLGADTFFSFKPGTRDMTLDRGTMLLQVPKNLGGAKIHTAAVTAAITGTTIMVEHLPKQSVKVVVLEGSLRLYLNNVVGQSVILTPGKMAILKPDAKTVPNPVNVDLRKLIKTSALVKMASSKNGDGHADSISLPSADLIEKEIAKQDTLRGAGGLIDTNLVILGKGSNVTLGSDELLAALDQKTTATHANEHSSLKTGKNNSSQSSVTSSTSTSSGSNTSDQPSDPTPKPPVVIPTPDDSYKIGLNTVISTAWPPKITTGGVTDEGGVYWAPLFQGSASRFLFGTTSSFDDAVNFDTDFAYDFSPVAVFEFPSLSIIGTPEIVTAAGFKNLALISDAGITSAGSSEEINLFGLRGFFLGTKDGSITLGDDVAFADLSSNGDDGWLNIFQLHARNGDVTLGASVNLPNATVVLEAEKEVKLLPESDLTVGSLFITALNDATLGGTVQALDQIQLVAKNATITGAISAPAISLNLSGNLAVTGAGASLTATQSVSISADGTVTLDAPISVIAPTQNSSKDKKDEGDGNSKKGTTGSIIIQSADTIAVNSTVQVSGVAGKNHDNKKDDNNGNDHQKGSASISLSSARQNGVAISISNTGELLALLDGAKVGAGGKIQITSAGGAVAINGKIIADQGTVDIRNNGGSGAVNLTNATLRGDVVKIGALGDNGSLNIGGGTISADTLLKLYAAGSNGSVNFNDDVSLNGASMKIIAGETVTIRDGKTVTIGGSSPAQVFTDHPNYTGSGGNGSTTGQFGGKGATTQPFGSAPKF